LNVVEGRHLHVHRLAEDLVVRVVLPEGCPSRVDLDPQEVRGNEFAEHVEVSTKELEGLAVRVFFERPAQGIQMRKAWPEVAIVPDDCERVSSLPSIRQQLERSGTAWVPSIVVTCAPAFADRAEDLQRQDRKKRGVGLRQVKRDDIASL